MPQFFRYSWADIADSGNTDSQVDLTAFEKTTIFMVIGNLLTTLDGQTADYGTFTQDEIEAMLTALQGKMLPS